MKSQEVTRDAVAYLDRKLSFYFGLMLCKEMSRAVVRTLVMCQLGAVQSNGVACVHPTPYAPYFICMRVP